MQAIPQPGNCDDSCNDITTTLIPGPQGDAGTDGTDGSPGVAAYSYIITAAFTQPAVGADVTATVSNSTWMSVGQVVFVEFGGYYTVQATPTTGSVTLRNLGYTGNAAPTTSIPVNVKISPGGIKGTDGAAPSVTLNDLSPTDSKGDFLVDDGSANPNANVVRLPAPTDTYVWTADAAQASGWLAKNPKLEATDTLDFASINAAAQEDLTIALAGAAVGDPVTLGLPAAPTAGIIFMAFVSAVNTVTVRATNITAAPVDPASADYTVRINKL